MKKLLIIAIFVALLFGVSFTVRATPGCCSYHDGVCSERCADGSIGYYCCDGKPLSDICAQDYHECSQSEPESEKPKIRLPRFTPTSTPTPQPEPKPLPIKAESSGWFGCRRAD